MRASNVGFFGFPAQVVSPDEFRLACSATTSSVSQGGAEAPTAAFEEGANRTAPAAAPKEASSSWLSFIGEKGSSVSKHCMNLLKEIENSLRDQGGDGGSEDNGASGRMLDMLEDKSGNYHDVEELGDAWLEQDEKVIRGIEADMVSSLGEMQNRARGQRRVVGTWWPVQESDPSLHSRMLEYAEMVASGQAKTTLLEEVHQHQPSQRVPHDLMQQQQQQQQQMLALHHRKQQAQNARHRPIPPQQSPVGGMQQHGWVHNHAIMAGGGGFPLAGVPPPSAFVGGGQFMPMSPNAAMIQQQMAMMSQAGMALSPKGPVKPATKKRKYLKKGSAAAQAAAAAAAGGGSTAAGAAAGMGGGGGGGGKAAGMGVSAMPYGAAAMMMSGQQAGMSSNSGGGSPMSHSLGPSPVHATTPGEASPRMSMPMKQGQGAPQNHGMSHQQHQQKLAQDHQRGGVMTYPQQGMVGGSPGDVPPGMQIPGMAASMGTQQQLQQQQQQQQQQQKRGGMGAGMGHAHGSIVEGGGTGSSQAPHGTPERGLGISSIHSGGIGGGGREEMSSRDMPHTKQRRVLHGGGELNAEKGGERAAHPSQSQHNVVDGAMPVQEQRANDQGHHQRQMQQHQPDKISSRGHEAQGREGEAASLQSLRATNPQMSAQRQEQQTQQQKQQSVYMMSPGAALTSKDTLSMYQKHDLTNQHQQQHQSKQHQSQPGHAVIMAPATRFENGKPAEGDKRVAPSPVVPPTVVSNLLSVPSSTPAAERVREDQPVEARPGKNQPGEDSKGVQSTKTGTKRDAPLNFTEAGAVSGFSSSSQDKNIDVLISTGSAIPSLSARPNLLPAADANRTGDTPAKSLPAMAPQVPDGAPSDKPLATQAYDDGAPSDKHGDAEGSAPMEEDEEDAETRSAELELATSIREMAKEVKDKVK